MEERTGRKQKYRRMKKRGVFTILALLLMGYFVITNMNRSEPVSKNVASTETEQPKKEQKEEVKEKKQHPSRMKKKQRLKLVQRETLHLVQTKVFHINSRFRMKQIKMDYRIL